MPKVKNSSNIARAEYDQASKVLVVDFTDGSIYQYSGVPNHKFTALMSAPSKGEYFAAMIRGKYRTQKLKG